MSLLDTKLATDVSDPSIGDLFRVHHWRTREDKIPVGQEMSLVCCLNANEYRVCLVFCDERVCCGVVVILHSDNFRNFRYLI